MPDSSDIEIQRDDREDGLVLAPQGDVDLSRSASLRTHLASAIQSGPPRLVVDMAGVDYMDSSGVATLIEAMQLARTRELPFVLCALKEQVMATLQITRLDVVFTITDTRDEAFGA